MKIKTTFYKSMIKFIEFGNIFNIEGISNYAHGCNCAGAMGKGIALQFKKKYPNMYFEYKYLCKNGLYKLGDIFTYDYGGGTIFNLGTQINWKTKADINAIEESLNKMLSFASHNNIHKIALPKIGAGLGGLDWGKVKIIIEKVSKHYPNIDLFVVENYSEI